MYYVNVLKTKKDRQFYIGRITNLKKRIGLHNKRRVESTKYRRPFTLIYYAIALNQKDALKRERYLKTTYGHRYIRNRVTIFWKSVESIYYIGEEGSGSTSKKEFIQFLNFARRSTFENVNMVIIYARCGFIRPRRRDDILQKLDILCRKITVFKTILE